MDRTPAEHPRTSRSSGGEGPPLDARRIRVTGAVQGVGFRPFVHGLARALGLSGLVRNDSEGVDIVVEGPPDAVSLFLARLVDDAPPLAMVQRVETAEAPPSGAVGFSIVHSETGPRANTLVTADAATCPDCLRELRDPRDRRHRYPFINCTNCGPRFTITRSVPYDRPHTTMSGFTMCPACRREYEDPDDRRFHAQPNACPDCGPSLWFQRADGGGPVERGEAALARAVAVLKDGGIVAVKGLGGYHLACDATREASVLALRRRKRRDERPFAVMVADAAAAARFCTLTAAEEALLSSPRRPVMILDRRALASGPSMGAAGAADGGAAAPDLAPAVAPDVATYGLFLPYTPLHHLLLDDVGRPLVMTSGNVSEEPIAFRDDDARSRFAPLADAILGHDRGIHMRTDDSVARTFRTEPYLMRRARGWAPLPVTFSGAEHCILAVGAHLKNTFALTRGDHAFLSHHIGDLENLETVRSLEQGVAHYQGLFDLHPAVVAHDLHPDYLSTRFALAFAAEHRLPAVAVQHHEAHVASVLADAGHPGPVVGVAFDGAGFGPDGTVWGGEVFAGAPGGFARAAHLALLPQPGGDQAVREPWRLALALLELCGALPDDADPAAPLPARAPGVDAISARPWPLVLRAMRAGVNTPLTSSAGRLFDAISSLLGLRHEVGYEGQAAVLLEAAARRCFSSAGAPSPTDAPAWAPFFEARGDHPGAPTLPTVLPIAPFGRAVLADTAAGASIETMAARFHHALARFTADAAETVAAEHGLDTVALGGGVFQNLLLLELLTARLEHRGLRVLVHRNVPTNDGGLCLGQAETVAALTRSGLVTPGIAP